MKKSPVGRLKIDDVCLCKKGQNLQSSNDATQTTSRCAPLYLHRYIEQMQLQPTFENILFYNWAFENGIHSDTVFEETQYYFLELEARIERK